MLIFVAFMAAVLLGVLLLWSAPPDLRPPTDSERREERHFAHPPSMPRPH